MGTIGDASALGRHFARLSDVKAVVDGGVAVRGCGTCVGECDCDMPVFGAGACIRDIADICDIGVDCIERARMHASAIGEACILRRGDGWCRPVEDCWLATGVVLRHVRKAAGVCILLVPVVGDVE